MAIYLIRHGETAANAARIVQTPDVPLSQRGLIQADRLADRLADADIEIILCSDLRRAVMTAESLQRRTTAVVRFDPGLQERNYGDIRGRAYAEFDVDILGPDYEPPGGETWNQFDTRVDAMWERVVELAAETSGSMAVVTHGLVCRGFATRHLDLGGATAPLRWSNTSLTIIDSQSPWRVRLLNCTAHLGRDAEDDTGTPSGL